MTDAPKIPKELVFAFKSEEEAAAFETFWRPVFKNGLINCIEYGYVEIQGKSADEIVEAVVLFWFNEMRNTDNSRITALTVDYRDALLARAEQFDDDKPDDYEISVTLYATWLEHTINGFLRKSFIRQGLSDKLADLLLRKFTWNEKIRELWTIAELPRLSHGSTVLAQKIIDRRNAFVHYKWKSLTDVERLESVDSFASILENIEDLLYELLDLEERVFWKGRREEIMKRFEALLVGFFSNPQLAFTSLMDGLEKFNEAAQSNH
ncbi:hypothetical protein [Pseudonocardia humida]|uniref:Apea-like HEPN domain-containing protein n=1 Tax=Pseudonocardia humida TaxID=2800819 RepID=A0ABT1A8P9_9PSEU|nr:hypothetical protein [Pseudonocardia humida]MCO1659392.1 hypothetical protein [Pseudonocardia humida]